MVKKQYIADGVYAEIDRGAGLWVMVLTTEDGARTTNTIYFELETWKALLAFVEREKQNREPSHQTGCICADCAGAELTADND